MIIKLYKNCILTDAYSEVFDVYRKDENGKTALDRYLETLEQKTIAIPHAYVTNSGKISFDLIDENDTEFYDFNYMSIHDETNNFARFCFIDAVTVVNGIAVVSYIEDIWSNYAPSMQMRKSLLTRSRIIDYGVYKIPFYSLGMEYQGNNQVKLEKLVADESSIPEVSVVCQFQLYTQEQQGTINDRLITEAVIRVGTSTSEANDKIDIPSAQAYLQQLIRNSSTKTISFANKDWNYEVYNIVFVPTCFNINFAGIAQSNIDTGTSISTSKVYFAPFSLFATPTDISISYTKKIACNYKQFQIGSIVSAYELVQNGTSIEINLGYYFDFWNFRLFLKFQNQVIDVTKDFSVEVPITVQTADVTQQQATAREVADLNAKLGIASGAMQISSAITDTGMGAAKMALGASTGKVGNIIAGAEQINNAPYKAAHGVMNIISSAKQLEVANRAMYTTNKGAKVDGNTGVAASYGIVIYEMQPDNEVEVQANIDNCGYVCNEIVDNLLRTITTEATNKWNVMQFDYVNIYGKFTQRIADALRDILYAGFKIWYDETAINE